jgi:mitogen-activated protein kinase organizer 1
MELFTRKNQLKGAHSEGILCCSFSPTGTYLLSGGQDRAIVLWNVDSGRKVTKFDGHSQAVRDVKCSNDSATLISGGQDKQLLVWDVGRVVISRKIRAHDGEVNCVQFSPDNAVALTGGGDAKVNIWDMRSRSFSPMQTLTDAKDGISSISVSKSEICVASLDGHVRQYDMRNGKLKTDVIGAPVMGACYSTDTNCILVSTLDDKVRLFDKLTGELLNEYRGHRNNKYKTQAILSRDDSMVLSGSEDFNIYVWDLVEAKIQAVLKGHSHVVSCLAYSPVTDMVASGSIDRTICVWTK